MKKILAHLLIMALILSAFPVFASVGIMNASATGDTHTWDGGGTGALASEGANWDQSNTAPQAGDSVIFDTGKSCTWDLAIALDAFSINSG